MITLAKKQAHSQQTGVVEVLGSIIPALCIAAALILDHYHGWGDSRRSFLSEAVIQVMLPLLAVWIVVALMEHKYGRCSIPLLLLRCTSAIAPAVSLAFLNRQGHLLSPWISAQLSATTVLSARGVGQALVILAGVMATISCIHVVWRPFQARRARRIRQ